MGISYENGPKWMKWLIYPARKWMDFPSSNGKTNITILVGG
jgi:hypothetical protein